MISNKKKIIIIVSVLLFIVILIPIVLIIVAFGLPPVYDESFYGGMKIKYDRLKDTRDERIIFIGGSSLAFGLRSDLLEQQLGKSVVNFGLYANLGTKYMLDIAESQIKEGDTVIIAPEQNRQALSLYFNGEAAWYSMDGNFELLPKVSFDNVTDMAANFLTFTSSKFGYLTGGNKPKPDGVYNADSFNEYGDIVFEREYNTMPNDYDSTMPISFSPEIIENDFIDYLNDYRVKLINKGAKVYFSFCPMNRAALCSDDKELWEYYDLLTNRLDFTVLGNPESHLLSSEWFYDSNFHLNSSGAVLYTSLIAQEIKAETEDYSPIVIPIPEKPKKPVDNGVNGIISEDLVEASKIFNLSGVYIETGEEKVILKGTWCVDGLTEYGKTLKDIKIPDTLAGLPVTKIADEAFRDNEILSEITFGVNIGEVGRKAIFGCRNLHSVWITSKDPNSYHPALDIFDGLTDICFYVPKETYYSDYLTDYFWAQLGKDKVKPY